MSIVPEYIPPKRSIYLKVKIKSLAEEARIIRLEERRAKSRHDTSTLNGLHSHRVINVREEARRSLLAYAYIRGIPYHVVEQKHNPAKKIDWDKVNKLIRTYSNGTGFSTNVDAKKWAEELVGV